MTVSANTQRRIDVALEALRAIEASVTDDTFATDPQLAQREDCNSVLRARIDNAVRIYCAHEIAASNYAQAGP